MRRWVSFMAMRRISWIDQRIRNDVWWAGVAFFWVLTQHWPDDG
jgi:hypothetical protein